MMQDRRAQPMDKSGRMMRHRRRGKKRRRQRRRRRKRRRRTQSVLPKPQGSRRSVRQVVALLVRLVLVRVRVRVALLVRLVRLLALVARAMG